MRNNVMGGSKPLFVNAPAYARPKAVAEEMAAHERAMKLYETVGEEEKAAKRAIPDAEGEDVLDFAERLREDENAEPTWAKKKAVEARLADLQAKRRSLDVLYDETGTAVARAIDKARPAWLAKLEERRESAAGRFEAAVAELEEAARELGEARNDAAWLESWSLSAAMNPGSHRHPDVQYRGISPRLNMVVPVRAAVQRDGGYVVTSEVVISALRQAVAEPPPPRVYVPNPLEPAAKLEFHA